MHTASRSFLVDDFIAALAARLPPADFARVHRSTLVRLDAIAHVQSRSHGDGIISLRKGAELRLSRRYREEVRCYLND